MSVLRLVSKNLLHHRWSALSTALCVAVAVAVLAGALLVGDSVRGSLRHLALDGLGPYDDMVISPQPFRAALAEELAQRRGFADHFAAAVPVLLLRGTLEWEHADGTRRASSVTIIGCTPSFWTAGGSAAFPPPTLTGDSIAINAALAAPNQLGAKAGQSVVLRINKAGGIPPDSPLGQKERSETMAGRELTVRAVVPDRGLGRFSLNPSQQVPLVAFVDLATLQSMLDRKGSANAILLAGRLDVNQAAPAQWNAANIAGIDWVGANLRPTLADYGLSLRRVVIGDPKQPVNDYWSLTSQRMLLPEEVVVAANKAWQKYDVQPVMTYLANALELDGNQIPYSTIAALDSRSPLGPLEDVSGKPLAPLAEDEIVLTQWAADDLAAKPGDMIRVVYFEPETTHGAATEKEVELKLKAIVPLSEHGSAPQKTNDPHLTPELKGVTDSESIEKWLVPFKLTRTIRPRDDQYWTDHRTTPKAYVSSATGRRLWGSRFGHTTSLRVPAAASVGEAELAALLQDQIQPDQLGLIARAIKRDALAAATGTTPFDALFLAFSMVLILAVLMLLAVLFQLGIDERAGEIGLLMAVGISQRRITGMLLCEAMVIVASGTAVGLLLAGGYAALVLAGLRTGWLSAVAAPQLEVHITLRSLLCGAMAGVAATGITILVAVRRVGRIPVRRLLAGVALLDRRRLPSMSESNGWRRRSSSGTVLLAIFLAASSALVDAKWQPLLFFASGALTLIGGMLLFRRLLYNSQHARSAARVSVPWLASRSATMQPRRSLLCVGLLATVAFLIIATGAFRLDVSNSGSGGFNLLAESSLPVFFDLATLAGRAELGLSPAEEKRLQGTTVAALRVHDGDDASCLNLYRPQQPRILGVPSSLTDLSSGANRFDWGAAESSVQPWQLLEKPLPPDATGRLTIPVILDENTARYSLGLYGGVGETFDMVRDANGRPVVLKVVGLLRNSIFQGDLLISEKNLLKLFPDTHGYRYFLIRTPSEQQGTVVNILEDRLGDFGLEVTPAGDRLAALLAVQNTFLATFQGLGALGLLLGTFGLAAVQLRSVLERRGELALLRAGGFRRRRLALLVLGEVAMLMLVGTGLGAAAATVAIAPHLWEGAARLPWLMLCVTLAAVLACGLAASLAAVFAAVSRPLVPALRGE